MTKLPAFQFYPADWRKDLSVQSLPFFDRGVWFEILCLMHESEQRGKLLLNGKPMPDEVLARLLGLDKQILSKTLSTILEFGVATRDKSGVLLNRRMVSDEELRQIRTEAGKKGGNPVLVKQNPTKTKKRVKQKSTPSSSSSSSSSATTKTKDKPIGLSKKGYRIPDEFLVSSEMRTWAAKECPTIDWETETKKFCNHFRSKTGNATKLNWQLTWENWMLTARDRFGGATYKNGNSPKPDPGKYDPALKNPFVPEPPCEICGEEYCLKTHVQERTA